MKKSPLSKDWFLVLNKPRAPVTVSFAPKEIGAPVLDQVPPFMGISKNPLRTAKEVRARLNMGSTYFTRMVREKMINPQPMGGHYRFADEEIENYLLREHILFKRKHA